MEVRLGAWVEAICISVPALANSWASLKVTKNLDGDRFGLLGGAVGCPEAREVWTISVRTSAAEDSTSYLNGWLASLIYISIEAY
jgi:hypothetical protein